jgi:hypothetical protein
VGPPPVLEPCNLYLQPIMVIVSRIMLDTI